MPAESLATKRRYMTIKDGKFQERLDQDTTKEYTHLSGVYLVDVTYRDVEKGPEGAKVKIGDELQLHLVDQNDYFVVGTWLNGSYAKSFFMMMENLNFTAPFVIITDQKIVEGKKKPSLFLKQYSSMVKWHYTRDNMGALPPIEVKDTPTGKVYDDTMQQLYFMEKVSTWLLPALKRVVNPFPNHPLYSGNVGNNIAGNGFGKETHYRTPGPISGAESSYQGAANNMNEPLDDLPF